MLFVRCVLVVLCETKINLIFFLCSCITIIIAKMEQIICILPDPLKMLYFLIHTFYSASSPSFYLYRAAKSGFQFPSEIYFGNLLSYLQTQCDTFFLYPAVRDNFTYNLFSIYVYIYVSTLCFVSGVNQNTSWFFKRIKEKWWNPFLLYISPFLYPLAYYIM